jgi:ATP-dependent RNA helicase RhlE
MTFEEMGLRKELLRVIREMNYALPTPVQERGIPKALKGRDLMCCAQTGTGKTAAFAFPILQRLSQKEKAPLRAVILVPTRELALQVDQAISDYAKYLDIKSTVVYGGVPIEPQEWLLRLGPDIVVATPGRLIDHMWRGNIDYRNVEYLVLDEADRMLDMGFIDEVTEIIREIPKERQSMLFSATLDKQIVRFAKGILKRPERVEVAPPATTLDEVDQFLVSADRRRKRRILESLIKKHEMKRAIIFARTKSGASDLAGHLKDRRFKASAIHSDRTQSERTQALRGFKAGKVDFLVATDIAARGIDIDNVSHVVNYDLPMHPEDYVHRIGRTARAGRKGTAISLVMPDETKSVKAIENLIDMKIAWLDKPKDRPSRKRSSGRRNSARPKVGRRHPRGGNTARHE